MQTSLFKNVKRDASFDGARQYRYWLKRQWGENPDNRLAFIGLNPSQADAKNDDATIRRVMRFAAREGYDALVMLNLFCLISTDPKALLTHPSPNDGTLNDAWLHTMVEDGPVVFCWGSFPLVKKRALVVGRYFPQALCFGLTKDGFPKHPCRLHSDTPLIPFH